MTSSVLGSPAGWLGTFPQNLIPKIFDLVFAAWHSFIAKKPLEPDADEELTTSRLKFELRETKEARGLPFRIEDEVIVADPATGERIGRIDLQFASTDETNEEIYFSFECKRLNAQMGTRNEALSDKYVNAGMVKYMTKLYARHVRHGGMLAYVLDGDTKRAIKNVDGYIKGDTTLGSVPPKGFRDCSLRPGDALVRETVHQRDGAPFTVFHVFVANVLPKPASPPAAPPPAPPPSSGAAGTV